MISVVIPVYNEKESVAILHAELMSSLKKIGDLFEIIFIDDGSTDGTAAELKKLSPARTISFTRNFGKSQALLAGFQVAKGEYIFTLDGDLQDNPGEMPKFLDMIKTTSSDLVCGWKKHRLDSVTKRIVSRVANGIMRIVSGIPIHDINCGFKLYKAEVVKNLDLSGDMHRYIPILVSAKGFRISEVVVNHRKRKFGVSKYGNFRRFFKSFFDFITLFLLRRFVDRPMHFFGIIGTLFSVAGGVVLAYLSYIKIFDGASIGQRPLLLLGILLMVIGIQLFSSGFLGELIVRQKKDRTIYTIREESEQYDVDQK